MLQVQRHQFGDGQVVVGAQVELLIVLLCLELLEELAVLGPALGGAVDTEVHTVVFGGDGLVLNEGLTGAVTPVLRDALGHGASAPLERCSTTPFFEVQGAASPEEMRLLSLAVGGS